MTADPKVSGGPNLKTHATQNYRMRVMRSRESDRKSRDIDPQRGPNLEKLLR